MLRLMNIIKENINKYYGTNNTSITWGAFNKVLQGV